MSTTVRTCTAEAIVEKEEEEEKRQIGITCAWKLPNLPTAWLAVRTALGTSGWHRQF